MTLAVYLLPLAGTHYNREIISVDTALVVYCYCNSRSSRSSLLIK